MTSRLAQKWIYHTTVAVAIALVAWLQASAFGSLMRAWLHDSVPPRPVPPLVVAPPAKYDRIVRLAPPARDPEAPVLALTDCPGVELSIVSEARDSHLSLASVRAAGGSRGRLLREGSQFGALELIRLGYDAAAQSPAAWFRQARGMCRVLLFAGSRSAEIAIEAATPEPQVPPFEGIVRVGPHDFVIEHGLVERLLADVATSRDALPVFTRGGEQIRGVTLRRVRPGSWVEALGLMTGDRLEAVNGHSLTSPRQVLETYGALRDARELSLSVFRGGTRQKLHYEIR